MSRQGSQTRLTTWPRRAPVAGTPASHPHARAGQCMTVLRYYIFYINKVFQPRVTIENFLLRQGMALAKRPCVATQYFMSRPGWARPEFSIAKENYWPRQSLAKGRISHVAT